MIADKFRKIGEYAASGAFEEPERSLFYRKALGIRRYYENCSLYPYVRGKLYPSGTKKETMRIYPHYLRGLNVNDCNVPDETGALIEKYRTDFNRYQSKVPEQHAVAGNMYCHSMPNYGRIIGEGFHSYADRINNIKDKEFREGLIHIYEGIRCYIDRCVRYLKEEKAEERLIKALERVPLERADNIYEAIVSWNFVMYLDNCDNLGCVAKELYPFYNGEYIVDLLENLYDNLDSNNGYSMALHTDYNELTVQCLKAAKGKRRPMIELFVDKNTPDEIWNTAFEVMRSHGGQPAFYNTSLLEKMQKRFKINETDIKCFCGGGCTESMIAGYSNVGSLDAGINLLLILEKTIYKYLPKAENFKEFYKTYIGEVKSVVDEVTEKISLSQEERALYNPLPMRTLLIDDCIDNETEYNSGGARYNWSIVNFAGMINVIDSMLTIKEFVFDDCKIGAEDFCDKLRCNDSNFLSACRRCKTVFGTDNNAANQFAYKLSSDVFSMLDNKKPHIGEAFIPASIQFMSQADAGKHIGATPDGRGAGQPLCDSLGAIFGKDQKGPTALLKSVTSIDLNRAVGVPVLNFNIDEKWNNDILKALILSYMEMGGIQMQITCISKELLQEAYKKPDEHKNLVVRVGGYSEYFCRLTDELRKMILDRTIQKAESI